MENTKIEWAHHTLNFWYGCHKVSAGCKNCYAETMANRFANNSDNPKLPYFGSWGPHGDREIANFAKREADALKWDKAAAKAGERHRVFVNSMADTFEDRPELVEIRIKMFDLIRRCPNLDFLILTKRPENIRFILEQATEEHVDVFTPMWDYFMHWLEYSDWPANVWLGTSVENQATADERIPHLLDVPAAKRFLSMEPLLGAVDLGKWQVPTKEWINSLSEERAAAYVLFGPPISHKIDWVIVGGESGHGARPMHPSWVRGLRDQCLPAGVPFFFKQWGEWGSITTDFITGKRPFREFVSFEHWVAKASTWVNGGITLDKHGKQLHIGKDFMEARDQGNFPVTIMHKIGKGPAGRELDGRTWEEVPGGEFYAKGGGRG